jgi:hypothetical protein
MPNRGEVVKERRWLSAILPVLRTRAGEGISSSHKRISLLQTRISKFLFLSELLAALRKETEFS